MREHRYGFAVGESKGKWDHVRVQDLAELYSIIVLRIPEHGGEGLPRGKSGIMSSGNERHSWMEVTQAVTDASYEADKIARCEVASVSMTEGTRMLSAYLGEEKEVMIELGLCSNSRTVASVAKTIGVEPLRGTEASKNGFRDDVQKILQRLTET